jgi:hypothetical protein
MLTIEIYMKKQLLLALHKIKIRSNTYPESLNSLATNTFFFGFALLNEVETALLKWMASNNTYILVRKWNKCKVN